MLTGGQAASVVRLLLPGRCFPRPITPLLSSLLRNSSPFPAMKLVTVGSYRAWIVIWGRGCKVGEVKLVYPLARETELESSRFVS